MTSKLCTVLLLLAASLLSFPPIAMACLGAGVTGDVGIIEREAGLGYRIDSSAVGSLVDADCEVDFSATVTLDHFIINDTTESKVAQIQPLKVGPGEVHSFLKFEQPRTDLCYRARIVVSATKLMGLFHIGPEGFESSRLCSSKPASPTGGEDTEILNPNPECTCKPEIGCSCTPIVVDLDGNGFHLAGPEDPVAFDMNADGVPIHVAWTHAHEEDAFLALDRNGNGLIDDGTELFGNAAPQPKSHDPNGFRALAVFDREEVGGNGDGQISLADAVFPRLLLWLDRNHDGVSQAHELQALASSEVDGIELGYVASRRRDHHGNLLRWSGMIRVRGKRRPGAIDVVFQAAEDP